MNGFIPPSRAQKIAKGLREWGHRLAMIPLVGWLLAPVAAGLSAGAALVDSFDKTIHQGWGTGLKSLIAGAVDTAANTTVAYASMFEAGIAGYTFIVGGNAFSWIATNDSIPELLRKGTEGIIDDVFPVKANFPQPNVPAIQLAQQNQILGASPYYMGSMPAAVAMAAPMQQRLDTMLPMTQPPATAYHPTGEVPQHYWTDSIAERRGLDPEAMRKAWAQGNAQEVRALRSAAQEHRVAEASV